MNNYSQEEDQDSPREYRSAKRRQQAEETRRDIIEVGRRLFVQQGYAATTVAEIAAEAGVSVPTVYTSVGGKRGIVMALVDFVNELGDETIIHDASSETDPRRYIQYAIKYSRQVVERGGDVIQLVTSTASMDDEVAAVLDKAMETNREVAGEVAQGLAERGTLQPHLTLKQVGDIISLMILPSIYDTLRLYGWSFDECETWIADMLIKVLLVPDSP